MPAPELATHHPEPRQQLREALLQERRRMEEVVRGRRARACKR
jgi:hypothetical protein